MAEITLDSNAPVAIKLVVLVSVFLFLAFLTVALRIPARRQTNKKLDLSDYIIFLAAGRELEPYLIIYTYESAVLSEWTSSRSLCLIDFNLLKACFNQRLACIIGGVGKTMNSQNSLKYIIINIKVSVL